MTKLSEAANSKLTLASRKVGHSRLASELHTTPTTLLTALDGGVLRAEVASRLEATLRTYTV